MARRKKSGRGIPELVRKTLLVDPAKLEQARKAVGASSDAELVRLAIDHLLSQFARYLPGKDEEE
jgi:hypothetical protein